MMQIYPTQVKSHLNISSDFDFTCNISILDSGGLQMYSSRITVPAMLDLKNLPSGIYILKLYNESLSDYRLMLKS